MVYWHCYLKRECGWQNDCSMGVGGHYTKPAAEQILLCIMLIVECGWQMAVPWRVWLLHKGRGRAAPIRLNNHSYHAVVLSVELKCTCV